MGLVPPPRSIPGTPQTRCREEFDRLFTLKYHQRFDHGLVIRPGKSRIRLDYRTASAGIGTAEMGAPNLPDVVEQPATTRKLTDLVDAVTNELDAYSRWLGRNPDGRGSLGAAALLPAELVDNRTGNVGELHAWAEACLADGQTSDIRADDLISRWPTTVAGKMAKPESVSAAQLLGHLGIGIEPDVRFGGPVLAPGPAVLFRTGQQGSQTASSTFNAATILLHLAVAVGQADGQVSASEHEHLVAHLETALGLPQPEQVRLRAHLQWLLAAGVKLSGLKKRLEALRSDQRLSIADFLLNVAAADGVIAPGEVSYDPRARRRPVSPCPARRPHRHRQRMAVTASPSPRAHRHGRWSSTGDLSTRRSPRPVRWPRCCRPPSPRTSRPRRRPSRAGNTPGPRR